MEGFTCFALTALTYALPRPARGHTLNFGTLNLEREKRQG